MTLFPGLDAAFLDIIKPRIAGDPMRQGVLWTNLSRAEIADELAQRGFHVSVPVVSNCSIGTTWDDAKLRKLCR